MREIVTIQIGGYANFVGSHFWNLQDELLGLASEPGGDPVFSNTGINLDVLYRVGETRQGVPTYTPRLLAFDSQGSLGAVRATGSLYEQPPSVETSSVTTWSGQVSKYVAEPFEKNAFLQSLDSEETEENTQAGIQQSAFGDGFVKQEKGIESSREVERGLVKSLEDNVQFWTDYSKVHFHPKSMYQLEGVWYGMTPFEDFGSGRGLLTGPIKEETQERLRVFVEECDHLQGLQVLVDDSNGFAGVAADFLETVADEYSRTPQMLFSTRSPSSFRNPMTLHSSTVKALHDAISFSELCSFSHWMVPVGLPSLARSNVSNYLRIDDTKDFHTSAFYGAAISCITLPFRMESSGPSASPQQLGIGSMDMATLLHLSDRTGRRISILDAAMPAPPIPGTEKKETFDFTRLQPLTSDVGDSDDTQAVEALVIQGALKADPIVCSSIPEVVDCIYRHNGTSQRDLSICHLAASLCPLAIPLPFPTIFGPSIGPKGEILTKPTNSNSGRCGSDVSSVPMAAQMRLSAAMLPYLESRLHNLKHFGLSRGSVGGQVLEGWGLQKDEVQELCEFLSKTLAAYGGDVEESSSDSD